MISQVVSERKSYETAFEVKVAIEAAKEQETLLENEFLKKVQGTVRERVLMIEADHKELSVAEQCRVLKLSRSA